MPLLNHDKSSVLPAKDVLFCSVLPEISNTLIVSIFVFCEIIFTMPVVGLGKTEILLSEFGVLKYSSSFSMFVFDFGGAELGDFAFGHFAHGSIYALTLEPLFA